MHKININFQKCFKFGIHRAMTLWGRYLAITALQFIHNCIAYSRLLANKGMKQTRVDYKPGDKKNRPCLDEPIKRTEQLKYIKDWAENILDAWGP